MRLILAFSLVLALVACGGADSGGNAADSGKAYDETVIFGKTLRTGASSRELMTGCFVFDMYWITATQTKCVLAKTDGAQGDGTQTWKTADGAFSVTTKDAKSEGGGASAWEIDGDIRHCRTSAAALYDADGKQVVAETKLMILGKSWDSIAEILPAETAGITAVTFAKEADCKLFTGE